MKSAEYKCMCDNSTGDTAISCCNVCGLPIQKENWYVNGDLSGLVHRDELKELIDKMIEEKNNWQVKDALKELRERL